MKFVISANTVYQPVYKTTAFAMLSISDTNPNFDYMQTQYTDCTEDYMQALWIIYSQYIAACNPTQYTDKYRGLHTDILDYLQSVYSRL